MEQLAKLARPHVASPLHPEFAPAALANRAFLKRWESPGAARLW